MRRGGHHRRVARHAVDYVETIREHDFPDALGGGNDTSAEANLLDRVELDYRWFVDGKEVTAEARDGDR